MFFSNNFQHDMNIYSGIRDNIMIYYGIILNFSAFFMNKIIIVIYILNN